MLHCIEEREQTITWSRQRTLQRRRDGLEFHTDPTVERQAVVPVPQPAIATDVIVTLCVHAAVQLQSEGADVTQRIAVMFPSPAPRSTAQYRALRSLTRHARRRAPSNNPHQQGHTASDERCCENGRGLTWSGRSRAGGCALAPCIAARLPCMMREGGETRFDVSPDCHLNP